MPPSITAVVPLRAIAGGRVALKGRGFPTDTDVSVTLGDEPVRVSFLSSTRIAITIPGEIESGVLPLRLNCCPGESVMLSIGGVWATGLHQVDNPVFGADGDLFVTYSGSRGQESPVSIFRVTSHGTREPFASGIVNPTSLAIGPDGYLYVSSRFEGAVYRVAANGTHEQAASELGVACGIAFDDSGAMYVGDRSGTVFRVTNGHATAFATLPPSVAAFHLAMSSWGELFVSAPTLGSYDHVYRIDRSGRVRTLPAALGRPQGLAFSQDGVLHVVDALAGASAVYRFRDLEAAPEIVVTGAAIVGVAFGPAGEMVVSSNDTAYRFER